MTRPVYVPLAVRLPPELKSRLEQMADKEQRPVSDLVRELLRDGLAKRGFRTDGNGP